MKLLPKNELFAKVNTEKKAIIDGGIFLAKKIDALREEMLTLQKERDEFISGSQKIINESLVKLQQKQDSLFKEIKELEVKRRELLKPLNDEWAEVTKAKAHIVAQKEENRIDREQINTDEKITTKIKEETSRILARTKYKEKEIEKARNEILSLQEDTQKTSELIKKERISQISIHEKAMSEVNQRLEEYENGIVLYENKKKDLEEREEKLLLDKQHLESQQRQLKIAYEVIKQNATNHS